MPFLDALIKLLPSSILEASYVKNELTIVVDHTKIVNVIDFLKNHVNCQFNVLIDICGTDNPSKEQRFEIVYHLLSISYNTRIRIKTRIDERTSVQSIVSIFESASWWEREVWDMFGIFFFSHPDLRRILTDYGFEGHPLRKDFPLTGFVEVRYDHEKKRVVHEPVELSQEYRTFEYVTPWEFFKK